MSAIREFLSPGQLESNGEVRMRHGHGHTQEEMYAIKYGQLGRIPDLVVYPENEEQVARLVEAAKNGNRNLELSSRNIEGVELVRSSDVHPYHLMRYDWAVFTQPVFEKMQASLKNSVPKRKRGEGEEKVSKKATASPRRKASREKAAEVA